jgi:hypothetical protein
MISIQTTPNTHQLMIESEKDTPLHFASLTGNVQEVKKLLSGGADVNCFGSKYRTPLHLACLGSYAEVIQLLIQAGAIINIFDDTSCTPLMIVVNSNNEEIVKNLLTAGAIISMQLLLESTGSMRKLFYAHLLEKFQQACQNRHYSSCLNDLDNFEKAGLITVDTLPNLDRCLSIFNEDTAVDAQVLLKIWNKQREEITKIHLTPLKCW